MAPCSWRRPGRRRTAWSAPRRAAAPPVRPGTGAPGHQRPASPGRSARSPRLRPGEGLVEEAVQDAGIAPALHLGHHLAHEEAPQLLAVLVVTGPVALGLGR